MLEIISMAFAISIVCSIITFASLKARRVMDWIVIIAVVATPIIAVILAA
jgi:uncharacterized membrane protein (UPF0182 family)